MLPPQLRAAIEGVPILVEDLPDAQTLAALGIRDPEELLGVFDGLPIVEQEAVPPTGKLPERIRLFRRPILLHCEQTGQPLAACVRETLLHEIGHFFGLSDEELAAYGL